MAVLTLAGTIVTVIGSVAAAFITGLFQISEPQAEAQASPPQTITQTATVTETVTLGSTHQAAPSTTENSVNHTPLNVAREADSLLHRQPMQDRRFGVGAAKVNGESYLRSMNQIDDCLSENYYQDIFLIDKKYTKFRAEVAIGDEGTEAEAEAEFAVSFGGGEPKYFFLKYGNEPQLVELDLVREPGEPAVLRLSARCKIGSYDDANLVWIDPVVMP